MQELPQENKKEIKLAISKRLLKKKLKNGLSKLSKELLFKTLLVIYFYLIIYYEFRIEIIKISKFSLWKIY